MQVATRPTPLRIDFGVDLSNFAKTEIGGSVSVAVPVLAGPPSAELLAHCELSEAEGFVVGQAEGVVAGACVVEIDGPLDDPSFQIYRRLFDVVGDKMIYRIWNYVPDINGINGALENYRAFNIGRQRAFEERFGEAAVARMAPASAVGTDDRRLVVAFLAGEAEFESIENPEQIPAYRYPPEHGPKAPCFTRGGRGFIGGRDTAFLSGTASVKDHRSVGSGDLSTQVATTLDNMRIVLAKMGIHSALEKNPASLQREFCIYLRDGQDLGAAREMFRQAVGDRGIRETRFLQADICRRELLVEVEGQFWRE